MNAKNDYSATPLSLACTNGNAAMVEKLLAAGANPNLAASSGETPLMRCARTGSAAAVKALLARKAQVDASNNEQGQTALMWAVAQKHPEAADALIKAGADIKARSKAGFTPLLFAARVGDVGVGEAASRRGRGRQREGAERHDAARACECERSAGCRHFPARQRRRPNARDELGATALHYAVTKGITALNQVRYANYVAHIFRPSLTNLVKSLLAHKADPNAAVDKPVPNGGSRSTGVVGATPYLLAAASPDPEVMRLLAAAGADPKAKTKNGFTSLMLAAGLGRGQDFTDQDKPIALEAVRIDVRCRHRRQCGDRRRIDRDARRGRQRRRRRHAVPVR